MKLYAIFFKPASLSIISFTKLFVRALQMGEWCLVDSVWRRFFEIIDLVLKHQSIIVCQT